MNGSYAWLGIVGPGNELVLECRALAAAGGTADLRYAARKRCSMIDGGLQNNRMVSFAEKLTTEHAEAIRAYVVSLATAELQSRAAPSVMPAA